METGGHFMLLFIIGIIGVIWFLLPFFFHAIFNIGNLTGVIVFGLIALAGLFRKSIRRLAAKLWKGVPGRTAVVAVCAVILSGAGVRRGHRSGAPVVHPAGQAALQTHRAAPQ